MKGFNFSPRIVNELRHYNKEKFMADLMAGLIVGIVALPLAIAFGIASGVSPSQGILTAIIGGFIVSALGGSKVQIGGPTGAFIVIIYGIVNDPQLGLSGLIIATMLAGAFLILLGVCRLGTIIKFIPYPIVVGFTSGIAVTIFTTQIKDLLGLQIEGKLPGDFISKWAVYLHNLDTIDWITAAVGILSIVIIALTPKISKKIPGSLVAIIVMTVGVYFLNAYTDLHVSTIGDQFGEIKATIPPLTLPNITWDGLKGLLPTAMVIAVLGAIESLLSATVADGVCGDRHNSNQELIGQGVANLCTPLFGGIPCTGAIARTMTNINNGGRTPMAGIFHAIVLLIIFLALMPLAAYIPMACLAGVLVIVSYGMSGWRTFVQMMRNPKSDITVLLITFFLTVIFDLTVAIEVGLLIACLLFMRRMAETTQIKVIAGEIDPNEETDAEVHEEHLMIPKGVEVYEINGPYFFGIASKFDDIMVNLEKRPKVRIIRMRRVPFIDSTGMHNLQNLCQMSHREGIHIVLSGVQPKVYSVLENNGFCEMLGKDHICPNINVALKKAEEIVK
ncbi:MAG: sulfate permease [Bacteroidaceae bacterium]|nr:sulfate permease [Paraprevotella sp.]MDD6822924.1 sulfate permease [Paraprevotella sp.]MDY3819955.1 sulfate permease [Bacteroidaceae bacterium]MDY4615139.1 sulfate permease [Bacteroidaceae bacterium]MDY4745493.1 sulfate permease [Bacteroidaceae bacterium]